MRTREVLEYMGYDEEEINKRESMSRDELNSYYAALDESRRKEAEEKNEKFILEFCLKADLAHRMNSGKYTRDELRAHRDEVLAEFDRGEKFYDESYIGKFKSMLEFEDVKKKMNNEETYLIDVNRLPSENERIYMIQTQLEFEKIQQSLSQDGGMTF